MKEPIRLIETICFENGTYPLLNWHQKRVNQAFSILFPSYVPHQLDQIIPKMHVKETYKVRVLYDAEQADITYALYPVRTLNSIKLIEDNTVTYTHKYENRAALETLFAQRGQADEILIIKKGNITDSFYANVAFWDGSKWYTPDTFLLNGVRRQSLLATHDLQECHLTEKDLDSFEKISLINAMIGLNTHSLPTSAIIR